MCSDGKLDVPVPSDSMGCLDNIPHRKPNKYDTYKYKYRKFGTACPSAPADTLADATDPTVVRAVLHSDRRMRRAARCRVPLGAHYQRALDGGVIRMSPTLSSVKPF